MKRLLACHAAFVLLLVACTEQPTSLLDDDGDGGDSHQGASSAGGNGNGNGGGDEGGNPSTGGEGQGGTAPQPANFEITLDVAESEIELRDEISVEVSIAPHGYVGDVALLVAGLPDDVAGDLAANTVTLDGDTTETVTLTISSASDTTTGTYPFAVIGTVESGEKNAAGSVTVDPVITIIIPVNLQGYSSDPPNKTAFGDYPTVIKALPNMSGDNPITVNFYNADGIDHQIHADSDAEGFGHSNGDIPPQSMDATVRRVNSPGTYGYYPHDIGTTILGQIVIE